MQVYLVGGAVRDELLGLPVRERDWVVLGATPEEMHRLGFKPVGRHFPVFLHPDTKEEYALARTERKTGPGYRGFEFHTGPDVTLEEDLRRRDLTINAIARDADGELIDPWEGKSDLESGVLRHVSLAFAQDPVRVLRVARFAARFHSLGFQIAPETMALMRGMVDNGEVGNLVAERVWKECEIALSEPAPSRFFITLKDAGVLAYVMDKWFPQLVDLLQSAEAVTAVAESIDRCAVSSKPEQRPRAVLAALAMEMTAHGVVPDPIFQSMRMPSLYSKLGVAAAFCWSRLKDARRLDAQVLFDIFERTGAFRNRRQLMIVLDAWRFCNFPVADRGRSLARIHQALKAVDGLDLKRVVDACQGNIGKAVHKVRLQVLSQVLSEEYDEQDCPENQAIDDEGQQADGRQQREDQSNGGKRNDGGDAET